MSDVRPATLDGGLEERRDRDHSRSRSPRATCFLRLAALLLALLSVPPAAHAQTSEPVGPGLMDALQGAPELQAMRLALHSTPLGERLKEGKTFTLLVPIDEAFAVVAYADLRELLGPRAVRYLSQYILPGAYSVEVLRGMLVARGGQMTLRTLSGSPLGFSLDAEGQIVVGGVARLGVDRVVANGVLIVMDNVLPIDAPRWPGRFVIQPQELQKQAIGTPKKTKLL